MTTLETIAARRSVKSYDSAHRMTDAEIRQLLEAAMQSPTAFNIQHWRFVTVLDPEIRKQIRVVGWDQAQITDASLLIVMCADKDAWKKEPARYWKNAAQPIQDFLVPAIGQYYAGRDQVQRDECMRSCAFAGMTLMLAAKAMGYDSSPMDGFDFDAVGKIIKLPEDHIISFMLAIGKATQPPWPKGGQLSYDEVVIRDQFN